MRSCRKQKARAAGPVLSAGQAAQSVPVRRYSHPIRTKPHLPAGQDAPVEELLAGILEALSRHEELLEELLRLAREGHTEGR